MRRLGEQSYPYECCGVLLGQVDGDERRVQAIAPSANARTDSPQNRYLIEPRELIRVQREAREQGLDIIGFYHSHPDHPAQPSPTDLEEAHWLGCSYVITSVAGRVAGATRSFLLEGTGEEDKRFMEEEIHVAGEGESNPLGQASEAGREP